MSLHLRRLLATTDINYGLLQDLSTELSRPSKDARFTSNSRQKPPLPPPKDFKYAKNDDFEDILTLEQPQNGSEDPGAEEPFDIDAHDYLQKQHQSYLQSIIHPSKESIAVLIRILGWYAFSLAISLYNKWMFDKLSLNFPFPVLSTLIHQLILFILSLITLWSVPGLRPSSTGKPISMPLTTYLVSIIPCALASGGDIGCGNASLRYITLSLYTMVKLLLVAFVLIFGVLFKLEVFTWRLAGIVGIMIIGVTMMVGKGDAGPSNDAIFGLFLVLVASCLSGLRWALTQLVLKLNPHVTNAVATIFYLAPAMCVFLLISGAFLEGIGNFFANDLWVQSGVVRTFCILSLPGVLVFFMTIFELSLLQRSHVVTLSIAGIFKELLTIGASMFVFGDELSAIKVVGLFVTLADIVWYNYYRFCEKEEQYQTVDMEMDELEV